MKVPRHRIPRVRSKDRIPAALPPERLGFIAQPVVLSEPERDDADEWPEPEDQEDEKPARLRRLFDFSGDDDVFDDDRP